MSKIDLHIHTVYSDGTFTPEEAVGIAKELGLVAISVTDHDSVSGVKETLLAGEALGVEVVPGVEMSTDIGKDEIHILGYYFDWKNEKFLSRLEIFQQTRVERNEKLLRRLDELGMRVDYREIAEIAPRGVISRLHIARLMVRKGYVSSIGRVFENWLNPGKPAYVKRTKVSPCEIIDLIGGTGGVPVLAHPFLSHRDDLIPDLVKLGLQGIEVYHPSHSPDSVTHYREVAERYGLIITGGSDCHGRAKNRITMGKVEVPL